MNLRKSCLPPGWYPRDPGEVRRFLGTLREGETSPVPGACAAAAPHAGWFFSGAIGAKAVLSLKPGAETVLVLGGHLPRGMPPLFAAEDGAETPLGEILFDMELRDMLWEVLEGREDRYQDNTVEVLLPMVKFFHPRARVLWIRLPAEESSLEAGKLIAGAGKKLGRNLAVLGSTDLTHYGRNYGFSPHGRGEAALKWVREVNDRSFIEAVEAGDPEAVLSCAENKRAACSAGAVLGALGFAEAEGAGHARLLAYGTSAAAEPFVPDSFVGYAALAWY